MVGVSRHLVHTVSWERKTGGSDWEGDTHAPAVEIPCRTERRVRNASGVGGEAPAQTTRIMVGPGPDGMPDVGDRLAGEIVEAVEDQVNGNGTVVGRICHMEPSGG